MQTAPVYLYSNTIEVLLDTDHPQRINNVMYQRTITIQRGLQNTLHLQIKNSDQKSLNISSSTFYFSMYDEIDNRVVVEKPITVLDDGVTRSLRGMAKVVFTEQDTINLPITGYKFVVKHMDGQTGSLEPVYSNTYYGVAGKIQLLADSVPPLTPSAEVTHFQEFYNADFGFQRHEYYSGNIDAHPEYSGEIGLHTVATYMTNYIGTVLVEGTMENSPSSFSNYAVISNRSYNQFTGIDYINFNGKFSKIRVRYIPAKNPATNQNNDVTYAGTVDRAQFR